MPDALVQCPVCGTRYPDPGVLMVCCEADEPCFPVTEDMLREEAAELDEGLRDAAADQRYDDRRDRGLRDA